jgi:DNA-binding response OmpR family regulator
VADDDVVIRELISTALASAGFDVNATCDGQQAWEALLQEHYDLLITDNEMPRLAGIELIERIHDAGMSLPVIIASGSFPMEKVRDHPELQIAAVLPKPFRILELLNAARHVFRASRGNTTLDRRTPDRRRTNSQPIRKCNKSNPVLCKP